MSHEPIQARTAVEDRDWDAVLARLRADGFSPVESIKVTRAVLRVSAQVEVATICARLR